MMMDGKSLTCLFNYLSSEHKAPHHRGLKPAEAPSYAPKGLPLQRQLQNQPGLQTVKD